MSKRWAVLIGINGYHESLGALEFCTNDATLMYNTLISETCTFASDNVILLTDDQPKDYQPTFGIIHSWLGKWLSRAGPDDLALIYFAGHGQDVNGQAFLAPLDATLDTLDVTGIPIQYVRDILDRCKAAQKILILDACHSGGGRQVRRMTPVFREALNKGAGCYTIAACDADQISYEWPEKKQGVFTYHLAEAISRGAPVSPDGRVSLDRVYETTREGVLAWATGNRVTQEPVRLCRLKGDIFIASRPLSNDQRLQAAQSQIADQAETISQLRAETAKLAQENKALKKRLHKKNTGANVKDLGKAPPVVAVPECREWIGNRGPYNWLGNGPLFVLTFGVGWWLSHLRWRNRYRLHCAQLCLEGRDYVSGSAYASGIGHLGVDSSAAGIVVARLADLAAENGDRATALALYTRGYTFWRNPYAKRAWEAATEDRREARQP